MNARDKIGSARLRARRRMWWFRAWLMSLRMHPVPGMGSISVDEGMRCYFDPDVIDQLSIEEVEALLLHEVQHPFRRHPLRARRAGGLRARFDRVRGTLRQMFGVVDYHNLANLAGDCEINDDLFVRAKLTMPHAPFNGILPSDYKMVDGLSMEEYMDQMLKRAETKQAEDEAREHNDDAEDDDDEAHDDADDVGRTDSEMPSESEDSGDAREEGQRSGEAESDQDDRGEDEGRDEGSDDDADADAPPAGSDGAGDGDAGSEEGDAEADDAGEGDAGSGGSGPTSCDDRDGGEDEVKPHVGHGACGGCAGRKLAHELADDPNVPDAASPSEVALIMQQVAHAIVEAAGSNSRGTSPGGWLTTWAKEMIAPPKVDPYRVLAAATRSAIAGAMRGNVDFANGPLSRRREMLRQYVGNKAPLMSVMRGPNPRVLFVVDTSGSMGGGNNSRLSHALAESLNIAKACQATPLGMAVDAAVHEVREIKCADDILKLTRGGGGTDMRAGIREASEPKHKADVIVLLTDGETPWPTLAEMPKHAALITVIINRRTPKEVGCPPHILRSVVHVDSAA